VTEKVAARVYSAGLGTMNDAPTLVVLAAGIGRRYGGLKQMDPVGPSGESIVDYTVYDAIRAGFEKVVFVIRRDIEEAFRATVGARVEARVSVEYVCQELDMLPNGCSVPAAREKPWGTGHAILVCREAVSGPFAALNADDFYGRESYDALAPFLRETSADPTLYSMVGFLLQNTLSEHGTVARGICNTGPDGCLAGVVERTKIERRGDRIVCDGVELSGRDIASMNIWGLKPSIFDHLDREFRTFLAVSGDDPRAEFFMPTVVNKVISAGYAKVQVLETGSPWFGVTYPEDKGKVTAAIGEMIRRGDYPDPLWT